MNTKNHISINSLLRSIIMILMMGWMGSAWAQTASEKVIYSTDFQDWKEALPTVPATTVTKRTLDGQDLTFSLNNTTVDPTGIDRAKFTNSCISLGYLRAEKEEHGVAANEAYIETSYLKNITSIKFTQAATGGKGKRGWTLMARAKGDDQWVSLHSAGIQVTSGEIRTFNIKTNYPALYGKEIQFRFDNFRVKAGSNKDQYAFLIDLEITAEVTPPSEAKISYYDADGQTLIGEQNVSGTNWTYAYGESNVTLGTDEVFRGWFDETKTQEIKEGTELLADTKLFAKVTPMEKAIDGNEYTYDFTQSYWRQEEHELISINKGAYNKSHGWQIQKGGTIQLQVAQKALVNVTLCNTSSNGNITVTDNSGKEIATLNAKASTDGTIQSFTYDGGKATTLTFTMSDKTCIHEIELLNYKPVTVSFRFPTDKIQGQAPSKIQGNKNNEVTLPTNALFYRERWTFAGWTDDTNTYEAGKTYVFKEDVTLTPIMKENEVELTDANQAVEVVWPFDHSKAPAISFASAKNAEATMLYNTVATINGQKVDVKLDIYSSNQKKFENTDARVNALCNGAEGAYVNNGIKFIVPAVYGMTVKINASDKVDALNGNNQTLFGEDINHSQIAVSSEEQANVKMTPSQDGKTLTILYTGDATTLDLEVKQGGTNSAYTYGFFKDITVVYPVLPNVVPESTIKEDDYNFPNEKAENAGAVKVQSSQSYSNLGKRFKIGDEVTIVATPSYGYTVEEYRVKGSETPLTTQEFTDETGKTLKAAKYTVTDGITTIEVIYGHETLHKVTAKVNDANYGTVSLSPTYENFYQTKTDENGKQTEVECWYTKNTQVTASCESSGDYVLNYWGVAGSDEHKGTDNSYTFTVEDADISVTAYMKEGMTGTVTFDISDAHVNGETPDYQYAKSISIDPIQNVKKFTVPTNYTFFKHVDEKDQDTEYGYTLTYWEDKDDHTRYELGNTYSFKKASITLIPHFEYNPGSQLNRINDPVIRYDFGRKVRTDHSYNPDSKEGDKICAQAVDLGNNTKTFWTTKVFVKVLENGQDKSHTRDVALWCDTGENGYIRNTNLEEWAAFGPGTTFWYTAGTGTKISILTYSPITSTTIDGVVPTLDEERTATERNKPENADIKDHIYVYSYTTQNPTVRQKIVIGDDYSYYQWIETATLAANLVNLHVSVDNDQHGKATSVATTSGYDAKELEDGGYAIRQGDRVQISFERLFGFEPEKIVDLNKTDADGNPVAVLKIRDDGKVDMVDKSDSDKMITVTPNEDGTWGKENGDDETTFFLKQQEPTEAERKEGQRTSYDVSFSITSHRNLQICFKEKATCYVTYRGGQDATGSAPTAEWLEPGDKFTIPRNQTLYYEGHTLDHWTDSENKTYNIGEEYTIGKDNILLHPEFTVNSVDLYAINKERTATWHFTQKDGAPEIVYEGMNGILVTQLQINDDENSKIDLKIDLIGKDGKFNNTSSNERIQINSGSYILFPATPNCKANMSLTSSGIAPTVSGDTLKINSSNIYAADLNITYSTQSQQERPRLEKLSCGGTELDATTIENQISTNGYITFQVNPWDAMTGKESIPEVTGEATLDGKLNVTKATIQKPECTVSITDASDIVVRSYTVKFQFIAPSDNPMFQSVSIGGKDYTTATNEIYDVPRSGAIKVTFNRTMTSESSTAITGFETSATDSELLFKYWDWEPGSTHTVTITPDQGIFKDIYGKVSQTTLSLTLHVIDSQNEYQHQSFDFIVRKDGDINEAINKANERKNDSERYYIFVPDGEYELTGNYTVKGYEDNHLTQITKPNVSLIGQSKTGVVLWNHPVKEHIRNAATLFLPLEAVDFYAQDLTLENRFDYWGAGSAGRAACIHCRGNRSVLKNIALKSWQDTYYSNYARGDFRGYFENSDIYGVVDYICGDGNIWFEKCNLIHRDRNSNNIIAAEQEIEQEWGHVFNECTIKTETENPQLHKDYNWTLARPWNEYPACTFLNTTMETYPKLTGWGKMETNRVIRFHEYRSKYADGTTLIPLTTRTLSQCSPAAGSDECVLTKEQADKYTKRNVLGGTDGFEPNLLCRQIDAKSGIANQEMDDDSDDRVTTDSENHIVWEDNIVLNDDNLEWVARQEALCYFLFKLNESTGKWIYKENTTANSVNLSGYGSGYYCVRAANQRGGLGAPTQSIHYVLTDPYELEIKQVGTVKGYGWSTICLPFNAKVPEAEGLKVYAATAHNKTDDSSQVTDFTMTLTPVDVLNAEKGYVVYGPIGSYSFKATSRTSDTPTILKGNPDYNAISSVNVNCYVLSNKTWGLGFYKYIGSTLAANRAWLPQDMVTDQMAESLSAGSRCIRLEIAGGTTDLRYPILGVDAADGAVYNMQGQRIEKPVSPGIYIVKNKGKILKK